MVKRTTKLRFRRIIRRRRRQVVDLGTNTEQNLDKHLVRRLARLPNVQRFLAGWIGLLFLITVGLVLQTRALSTKYQTVQPKSGGTYTEGTIGSFTNANPLFAANTVDSSVSKLVFSGLFKYDSHNKLVGDLAESISLDQAETTYTVILKKNLVWQDGSVLNAKDVVFTYGLIQNQETKSYLLPSFQNIKITATNDHTVTFSLPNTLSSFPYSLTNGIVPQHLLSTINPAQLRSNPFNNVSPVGSGPFSFSKVEVVGTANSRQERVALNANSSYHFGKPKLERFIVRTFNDQNSLIDAYGKKQLNAMIGLPALPDQFAMDADTKEFGIPLTGEVLVFFKTTQGVLKDPAVRKALVLTTNKKEIFDRLSYPLAAIDEPLLKSQIGYDPTLTQLSANQADAKKMLDAAGWLVDPATGIRAKAGQKLSFRMNSLTTSEYSSVTGSLQKQWRDIGVDMQVELQSDQDLQTTLALHNYDALLYGISIGPDPDVFAYWHGSQADPRSSTRLNFSEYTSTVANQALEGGRTRSDPQLRTIKYKPFLEAWRNDSPALALYQPRILYIARQPFSGLDIQTANSAADRYNNVQNWTIREELKK